MKAEMHKDFTRAFPSVFQTMFK